jgi:formate dehydrogenase subunit gamma
VSAAANTAKSSSHNKIRLPAEILRFKASERQLHWAIAAPFMICYATALVLVAVYNPDPTRPYRAVFSWTHRLSGLCLFLLPLWTVLRHRRDFDLHFRNVRTAWRWRLEDVKWLFLMGLSTLNKRLELPHQEKFNAAEKLNFMYLTASYPLYIVTGFLIWLPGVAFASWILHLSLAAMATPLIFGHVFMATINPDTRIGLSGMITGYVDRHWAQHHYRHWYTEHFGHLHLLQEPVQEPVLVAAAEDSPRTADETEASIPTEPANHKHNKDFSIGTWPPMLRPAPGRQSAPETM